MATSGRGSGIVGYNVQVAVDTEHHLIVTHELTNSGSDRSQLTKVVAQAQQVVHRKSPYRAGLPNRRCGNNKPFYQITKFSGIPEDMSNTARRWVRRQYLTQWQAQRRAALKAQGGRRVEVTLRGPALDDYLVVRYYLGKGSTQRAITAALNIALKQLRG